MTPVIIGCGTPVPGPLRSGPLKMENEKVVLIFFVNKNQILKQKYFILIYFCTKSSFAVISIWKILFFFQFLRLLHFQMSYMNAKLRFRVGPGPLICPVHQLAHVVLSGTAHRARMDKRDSAGPHLLEVLHVCARVIHSQFQDLTWSCNIRTLSSSPRHWPQMFASSLALTPDLGKPQWLKWGGQGWLSPPCSDLSPSCNSMSPLIESIKCYFMPK